jgi:hypothetical protein
MPYFADAGMMHYPMPAEHTVYAPVEPQAPSAPALPPARAPRPTAPASAYTVIIAEVDSDDEDDLVGKAPAADRQELTQDVDFIAAALDHFGEITEQVLVEHAEHCREELVRQAAQLQMADPTQGLAYYQQSQYFTHAYQQPLYAQPYSQYVGEENN